MDDRRSQGIAWWRILGWVLSLAAFAFVGRLLLTVDPTVWTNVRGLNIGLALLSLLLLQGWFILRFSMWQTLGRYFGFGDEQISHVRMWALSEFARYIPGNVWSFAARYKGARQRGGSRAGATLAVVIEALNLVAGAAFVTGMFIQPRFWSVWLLAAVVYVLVMPQFIIRLARWRKWGFPATLKVAGVTKLLLISLVTWTVYGLAQALMSKSLQGIATPNIIILSGANVAAWLVGYLSIITPMGLGVREVALSTFLASTVADGIGSVLAVLTRVWLILSELVFLGLVIIFSRKK